MKKVSNALCTLHSALAVMLLCAACEPDSAQFITVRAASSPALSDSTFLAPLHNTGLGDRNISHVDGSDFGSLEYLTDYEKRVYVFQGDIEDGVLGGAYLQFPLPFAPLTLRTVPVPPPDGPKWGSLRVYDVGVCSSLISWDDIGGTLFGVLLAQLEGNPDLIGVSRPNPSQIIPVLRMTASGAGALSNDYDSIILRAGFHVDEIDAFANEGCTNVDLKMDLEVRLVVNPGYHESDVGLPYACRNQGRWVGTGTAPYFYPPGAGDVGAEIVSLSVTVAPTADCGWFAGVDYVENLVVEAIQNQVSDTIRDEVRSRTIRPDARFLPGAENRACECDIDCSEGAQRYVGGYDGAWRYGDPITNPFGAGSGYRHDCVAGHCALRIEPERIYARPEGIEVVFAEDTAEALYPLLHDQAECGATRDSVPSRSLAPTRGTVPILVIP